MTHRHPLRPLFGDVDPMEVVYYGNYLRFFERGRCELMRAAGGSYRQLADEEGLHLPVTEAHLRYRQPARYDDPLWVETSVAWLKKASLRFDYRILREDHGVENTLVTGYTVHACVDKNGRIRPLPAWVPNLLKTYLQSR